MQQKQLVYKTKNIMRKLTVCILMISAVSISAQENMVSTFPDMKSKLDTHFPIEHFKDQNGKPYPVSYLEGKTSLINFWSSTCVPCIEELPVLDKLQQSLPYSNFIGITYDDAQRVQAFILKHPYYFEQITNAGKELKEYLTVQRFPMSLIIGKDGKVKEVIGIVTEEKMQLILDKLGN